MGETGSTDALETELRGLGDDDPLRARRMVAALQRRMLGKAVPARVGRYEVEARIGGGGHGVVYRGFDPQVGRAVAIKVLRHEPTSSGTPDDLLAEARALGRIVHPNVVAVHDVGTFEDLVGGEALFLVMDLVDGPDLGTFAATCPDWRRLARVLVGVGRGLAAAHRGGVLHRDLTPANILIGGDGQPRIVDFGLASPGQADGGTPGFVAPERRAGGAATPMSDLWSLCRVAQLAFDAQGKSGAHPPPDALRRVLERGTDEKPARRWPDSDALADAIERTTTRRGRLIRAGATTLALAGAVGLVSLRGSPEPDPCEPDSGQLWSTVWTEARASHASVAALGDQVEAWGARWRDARESACGEEPRTPSVRAAAHCLGQRLAGLETVLESLETGTATPEAAAQTLTALDGPELCSAQAPDPDSSSADPERGRAAALIELGRWDEAHALIDARVRGVEHGPWWTLMAAHLAEREGNAELAEARARDAWVQSEQARNAHVAVRALLLRARLAADGSRFEDAASDLAVADARIAAEPGLADLRAIASFQRGVLAVRRGDPATGEAAFREVLGSDGVAGETRLAAASALGVALGREGRTREALAVLEDALARLQSRGEGSSPQALELEVNLSSVALLAGDPETTLRHADRAMEGLERLHGVGHGAWCVALDNRGTAQVLAIRPLAGLADLERANGPECAARGGDPNTLFAREHLAVALWMSGRPHAAWEVAADAAGRARDDLGPAHPTSLEIQRLRIALAVEAGEIADARTALDAEALPSGGMDRVLRDASHALVSAAEGNRDAVATRVAAVKAGISAADGDAPEAPWIGEAWMLAADALLRVGDLVGARAALSAAEEKIDLLATSERARLGILAATLHLRGGDHEGAVAALERVTGLAGDPPAPSRFVLQAVLLRSLVDGADASARHEAARAAAESLSPEPAWLDARVADPLVSD